MTTEEVKEMYLKIKRYEDKNMGGYFRLYPPSPV
jgi:hypothetical protein